MTTCFIKYVSNPPVQPLKELTIARARLCNMATHADCSAGSPCHSPLESDYLKDFFSFSELRNQNQAVPDVAAPRSKDSPVFIYRHWYRRRCFSIPEMDFSVGFVLRLLRQPEFSHGGCEPKLFKTEFERRFDRPQHAARWQVGRPPYPKEASLRGAVPYIYPPYHVNECAVYISPISRE